MNSLFSLEGRIALVTGGGRGIGFAFASGLAEAGATVLINDIIEENAEKAVEAIRQAGGKAETLVFDVTDNETATAKIDDAV